MQMSSFAYPEHGNTWSLSQNTNLDPIKKWSEFWTNERGSRVSSVHMKPNVSFFTNRSYFQQRIKCTCWCGTQSCYNLHEKSKKFVILMTFSINFFSIRIFDKILYNTLFLRALYFHATLRIMQIHENNVLVKISPGHKDLNYSEIAKNKVPQNFLVGLI